MPTNLKLHRDEAGARNHSEADSYPFPSDAVRSRLIAGTVEGNPLDDAAATPEMEAALGAHSAPDRDADTREPFKFPRHAVTSTPDLIRQIEQTLGRMQGKLDDFKRDMDESFKFPVRDPSDDDWRPFAA